jgi:hypothetical protein
MALWSRPEPPGSEPVVPGEFEGRTAEEAMGLARRALGPSAELRCWKTRRGGVGGFFATEVFVVSVEPPAGALAAPPKGLFRRRNPASDDAGPDRTDAPEGDGERKVGAGGPHLIVPAGTPDPDPVGATPPAGPPAVEKDPPGDEVPPVITYERPSRKAGDDMADSLVALADGTADQLSLNFDPIPSHSFDEVLAEAEAAVAGVTAWSDRPGPSVQMVVAPSDDGADAGDRRPTRAAPDDGTDRDTPVEHLEETPSPAPDGASGDRVEQAPAPAPPAPLDAPDADGAAAPAERRRRARPKGPAASRPPRRPAAPTASPPTGATPTPQPIPDLFERLRSLGVPEAHLPDPQGLTLDAVARSMDGLPEAPPLPTAFGSVVAVVGTAAAVARTTRLLTGASPFLHGPRPDPSRWVWSPEDRSGSDRPLDDVLQEGDPLEVAGRVARRRLDGRPSLVTVEVVPGHPMRSHDRVVIASVQPDYVLGAIDASVKRADVVQWRDDLGVVDALALWGLDGTVSPAELFGVLPIAFVDGVPGTPVTWTLNLLQRAAEGAG